MGKDIFNGIIASLIFVVLVLVGYGYINGFIEGLGINCLWSLIPKILLTWICLKFCRSMANGSE